MKFLKTPSYTGEDFLMSTRQNYEDGFWGPSEKNRKSLHNVNSLIENVWERMHSDLLKTESSMLYSTEMEEIYSTVKQIFKYSEKDNFDKEKFRDVLKISELNQKYTEEFYKISHSFEKWAAQRRKVIKTLNELTQSIHRTQLYCIEGRFVLSSFSCAAAMGSIALCNMNMNWSTKMFFAAISAGALSFACNLIELYSSKSNMEYIFRAIQEDKECFESLERSILYSSVDVGISDMFPYGIDKRTAIEISHSDSMESNYLKQFSSLNDFSSLSVQEQICFAILLSNVPYDPNLLKDEEFISKVRTFSKSSLALKWWNRLKYKHLRNYTEKLKLIKEMKSYLDIDSSPVPFLGLVTFPIYGRNYLLATLCIAILNGLISFETYCQLFINYPSNETSKLKRLKNIFRKEYKELNEVYEVLSPHND